MINNRLLAPGNYTEDEKRKLYGGHRWPEYYRKVLEKNHHPRLAECCAECGAGWVRILEKARPLNYDPSVIDEEYNRNALHCAGRSAGTNRPLTKIFQDTLASSIKTLGWRPSCDCGTKETKRGIGLDVFSGSATSVLVAAKCNRFGIGCEMSPEYIEIAKRRTAAVQGQGVLI